jgi:hypothetical protein
VVAEQRVLSVNDVKRTLELIDRLLGALDMERTIAGIPDAYPALEMEVAIIPQQAYEEI